MRMILPTLVALALCSGSAVATSIRYVPIPERVARADLIVVGTVTEIEEKAIETPLYPGHPKSRHRIAVVKVSELLLGSEKKATELRIAFVAKEDQPNPGLWKGPPPLEKDSELLLFLRKHSSEDFYRLDGYFAAVKKGEGFAEALKETRGACAVLADPGKALKAKDPTDRMTAAWVLAVRYRMPPTDTPAGKATEEPIGAEESQAILEGLLALAEKDQWAFSAAVSLLNPKKEDGLEPPYSFDKAKTWVKEHAKSYRIKKLVTPPAK